MKSRINRLLRNRFGPVAILVFVIVVISFLTRLALLLYSAKDVSWQLGGILGAFFIGLFYDLVMSSYFIIPLVLYLWLVPDKLYRKRFQRFFLYGLMTILFFILVFNIAAEWFFWEEFSCRFNFIAVNYLVYTNEVIGNIRESYPLNSIIAGAVILTLLLVFLFRNGLKDSMQKPLRFGKRTLWALGLLLLPVISFYCVNNDLKEFSHNRYNNELAGDGIYELFAAFRNNQLDYHVFYKTIPDEVAFRELKKLLQTPDSRFLSGDLHNYTRKITDSLPMSRLNVILISVESLSGDFLTAFGNKENITPNLDTLSQEGLFFTRLYANGTRTVRGLEALSLSVPPTPGRSIVKRPDNEGLFTLGTVLDQKGYISKFIYGGYGYFDNMNYFFGHSGYQIADRQAIKDAGIPVHYENIWGVADEDLYTLVLKEAASAQKSGKPFFFHVMTTSNHRPYTYPEGRIDIPSHTGREGAVKYTDYAIGDFIRRAKKTAWFQNTLFVITADHCASSAGKTDLPVNRYHIPLIIYAPAHIQPQKVTKLMSQIDIPPTILGLLHCSYDSKFYGYNILNIPDTMCRAFIGTYQNLGYLKDSTLVILKPEKKVEIYYPDFKTGDNRPAPINHRLEQEAVSYYQTASDAFNKHYDTAIKTQRK